MVKNEGEAMYAKVIPAVRLPGTMHEFDYRIPEEFGGLVRRGSWVVVPWRGRPVDGLVTSVSPDTELGEKSVRDISGLGDVRPLDEGLVRLPGLIAERHFCSQASALKAFLPSTPKTKLVGAEEARQVPQAEGDGSPDEAARDPERLVRRYGTAREKVAEAVRLVRRALASGGSCVVVTPHAGEIAPLLSALRNVSGDAPVIEFSGGLTPAALRRAWRRALNCGQSVAVGSRLAAFAPVADPSLFLVLESDSLDLRQYDQTPRYDARRVCEWRAGACGADLTLMSHAPRLEEHVAAASGECVLADCQGRDVAPSLVDVSGNPLGRSTPLSPAVDARMSESLREGKKVLVFHNRRGSAGAMVCSDCSKVIRCSRCEIASPLEGGRLHCRRCGQSWPTPAACADCGSSDLRQVGFGTASLTETLRTQYPEARVAEYDPDDRNALEEADVIIGSRLLLHDLSEVLLDLPDFGLLVATDLESLLAHQGYRVAEEAWRTVRLMRDLAAATDADLLLQTVDPDNRRVRRLLEGMDAFMAAEAESREATGYPPSGTFITVTSKAASEHQARRAAEEFVLRAKELLAGTGTAIAGPLRPDRPYRDGRWRSVVAVKAPRPLPEELARLLRELPESMVADRNPERVGQ